MAELAEIAGAVEVVEAVEGLEMVGAFELVTTLLPYPVTVIAFSNPYFFLSVNILLPTERVFLYSISLATLTASMVSGGPVMFRRQVTKKSMSFCLVSYESANLDLGTLKDTIDIC